VAVTLATLVFDEVHVAEEATSCEEPSEKEARAAS
jgi:hypothetical protein